MNLNDWLEKHPKAALTADIFLLLAFLLVVFWICDFPQPAYPQASNATANQIEINTQVSYGLGFQNNTNLIDYVEPGTTTALYNGQTTVFIPPSTTDQAINLATLFPYVNTPLLWGVQDISNPGQSFSLAMAASAGSQKFTIAPGGFQINRVNGSAPILYVSNSDPSNYVILKVFMLAN
jgi:hypothetical protein